jgi:hypothetical protein
MNFGALWRLLRRAPTAFPTKANEHKQRVNATMI